MHAHLDHAIICDVSAEHARFGFAQAPVDLVTHVTTEPGKLVRMNVTAGFPFWEGSTWEWELTDRAETSLAHTAQSWALILQRLVDYLATGSPQPFFPAE